MSEHFSPCDLAAPGVSQAVGCDNFVLARQGFDENGDGEPKALGNLDVNVHIEAAN